MPIEPPTSHSSGPPKPQRNESQAGKAAFAAPRARHFRFIGGFRGGLAQLCDPHAWLSFRRKRFWAVVALLAYALAGYFLVPVILQREIIASLQQSLARPVVLEDVRIDPFVLSADLRGFHISEKDGSPLVGFDRLYIRFSFRSLLRWAWSFDEVRLEGASGTVIRDGATDTNIGRMVRAMTETQDAAAKPEADKPESDAGLPRLVIRRLAIVNAAASVTDRVTSPPFHTEIGPVNVEFSDFTTLAQKTGEQHIQVGLEGGATLEWLSQSGLNPLVSAGHVIAKGPYIPLLSRYFGDALKLSAPTGTLDAELDYRLEPRPDGTLALAVEHVGVTLGGLTLHAQGAEAPFLSLPEVRLTGGHLAWPEMKAGADRLIVSDAALALQRQADGRIGPAFRSGGPSQASSPSQPPPSSPPSSSAAGQDWSITLGRAEIKNAKAQFEDLRLRQPGRVEINSFDLALDGLSNQPGAVFPFSLASGVAGGTLKMQGRVSVLPTPLVDATLSVSDLRLAAAQAYLHDLARLSIDDGRFTGETALKLDADGLTASGRGEVRGLKLTDEVEKKPVVAWDRLGIDRYEYRQAANELQISQVALGGPYLRFRVAADQTTNFSHIFPATDKAKAAPVPGKAKAAPAADKGSPPLKVSVGKIVITKGAADYGDASLPLPFAVHISDLQGEVATLASAAASPTRVTLRGQVGEFGQAKIDGSLTPFDPARNTKVTVLFRNVEFPGLSPYTAKFAGRRIAKGRLDVDLQYAITGGKLNGANRVVIRDMELGEKLDVPGAMDLPLELAIALLKDDDGKIDIDLPVSGNLNDPQFDIGSVISQTVFKLLGNLITSPFRALAGLFGGGGEQLDHIDFAPGRAELAPPEREKIGHLAQALQKRPRLGLVVPGVLDPEADSTQLQLDALDGRIDRELGNRNTVKRQRQFLESLFEQRVGKDRLAPLKQSFIHPQEGQSDTALDEPAYVAALRGQVAKTEPLAETALSGLAQARAAAVAGALAQTPGLDPQRVGQRGSATARMDDSGAIPLTLDAVSIGR